MASWKLYTTKKFLARTVALVQGGMLLCDLGRWAIAYIIRPSTESPLADVLYYLGIFGGNARFTLPILVLALVMNAFLAPDPEIAEKRTVFGRIVAGFFVFLVLWFV